jgi:hypothetical protein
MWLKKLRSVSNLFNVLPGIRRTICRLPERSPLPGSGLYRHVSDAGRLPNSARCGCAVAVAGMNQERDLLRARSVGGVGIAVVLAFAAAHHASAQSAAGETAARGSRPTRDTSATNGPDSWDANHDGVYSCDEWKSYLGRLFALADRNRDGSLDASEFAVIRRAGAALAEADFGYFDENQDGKITRAEFVDKPSEFILQHDKNGDCRVTPDEMKEASPEPKAPGGRGKKS